MSYKANPFSYPKPWHFWSEGTVEFRITTRRDKGLDTSEQLRQNTSTRILQFSSRIYNLHQVSSVQRQFKLVQEEQHWQMADGRYILLVEITLVRLQ